MSESGHPSVVRDHGEGRRRVTNMELFFDLVYVFAVTQLSSFLQTHRSVAGAFEAALLLAMVWLLWAYTAWFTNWFDPDRIPVRLLLLFLMLVSLTMSAALPDAFHSSGVLIGSAYAVTQIVRSGFAVVALRGQANDGAHRSLALNFQRILSWCVVSGALAIAGGFAPAVVPRALLWLAAIGVDFAGGIAGFYTPGLGRTPTREWDIEGGHFAERCQAFLLIALGESIVVTGATFARLLTSQLSHPGPEHAQTVLAFLVAFGGSAAFWWLYFDRSADDAAEVIRASTDPGRLGRTAYHFIHPIMVGGIILTAAADEIVLTHPSVTGVTWTSWLILGGAGLYIAGHLAFKLAVWRRLSWQRVAGLVVLALLSLAAPHVTALVLSACAAATVVAVAAADHAFRPDGGAEAAVARAGEP